ncbi:MAG: lactonase family protein [Lachnospiraceae bacterium]|nr:lactonase family protein [Lachnospiraceae bacterium]
MTAAKKARYVVYAAGYTRDNKHGIRIYDFDSGTGRMEYRNEIEISNPSYISISHSGKLLYSITDQGVHAYKIESDGSLSFLNRSGINGMRGCYISTDYEDRFLFVAGYHDGKVTVLSLNKDGSIKKICEEIYHKGFGSVGERNFMPHIDCVKMTRDNKYLCATDVGMDHVRVYRLDHSTGRLALADIIRSEIQSAPHQIKFSLDGRFAYVIHEMKNIIDVYSYSEKDNSPNFEKIQTVSTVNDYHAGNTAAYAIQLSHDGKHMYCSNAGDNSVSAFDRNEKTGKLTKLFTLPISGDFPKDIAISEDDRYLLSINNESSTISFFKMDLKKKTIMMNGPMMKFHSGNCIIIHKLPD